jgi:hypothetical protein
MGGRGACGIWAFFYYTSVYALLAPKLLQLQMRKEDEHWLGSGPVAATSWFSGMQRSAMAYETLGSFIMPRTIYERANSPIDPMEQACGHEYFDADALVVFVESKVQKSGHNKAKVE